MQLLCFLPHLGSQLRKRRNDVEQQTETTLEQSPLIQPDKHDNAELIKQGISATLHSILVI